MNITLQLQRDMKILLEKMGFHLINTPTIQEKEGRLFVDVFVDDPKKIIGYQGETLFAFQKMFRLLSSKKYNTELPVVIDVNGYKRKREERIRERAFYGRRDALKSKKSVSLRPMNAYDRRIIHATLSRFSDIATVSQGEGASRFITIKPVNEA